MRLDIDSGGYDTAAEALVGGNRLVAGCYSTLTSKLGGFAAMGGDDKSSEEFVKSYDGAAAEVVGGIAELSTAFGTLATLTAASGSNHRRANAGSVYKRPQTGGGDDGIPGGDPETVSVHTPPSSLGADSQDLPEFWSLIVDHLQGYAWPSADVDRLRQAASAWRDMGSNLDRAPSYVEVAKSQLSAQRSPEIALARTALGEVKGAATDLAAECRSLAESCDEYAEKVETTRETVIGLLKDLAIEIGATAVVSGVLTVVTFGGAAVVGAGVATARAIACARRIIAAIQAIRAIRAIGVLARTLPKARSIRSALKKFQNFAKKPFSRRGPPKRGKPGDPVPGKRRPKDAPDDWPGKVTDNRLGDVWQKPGSSGTADSVRVMDPNARYWSGYVRYYNEHHQPIGLDGKPGNRAHTHIPKSPDGTWTTPEGWNP